MQDLSVLKYHKIDLDSFLPRFEKLFAKTKLDIPCEKFLSHLHLAGGVIAGSSILSCILGTDYPFMDMDIYIVHQTDKPKGNASYPVQEFEYWLYSNLSQKDRKISYANAYHEFEDIKNIRTMMSGELYMDIVSVESPRAFIEKNFDLSFCKVYFDGISLYSYQPLDELLDQTGYITNMSSGCTQNNYVQARDCAQDFVISLSQNPKDLEYVEKAFAIVLEKFNYCSEKDQVARILMREIISKCKLTNPIMNDFWYAELGTAIHPNEVTLEENRLITLLKMCQRMLKYYKRGFQITAYPSKTDI